MHNDPTEPQRAIGALEPLQGVYRNPYEPLSPYGEGVPLVPPPPPKQRPMGLILASISLLCFVMILGGVIFGILIARGQQTITQVTSPPPLSPTSTPVPVVSYAASAIYSDFSVNGLGGTNPRNDTNWRCCSYTPEGGALVWTDRASGYTLDIATFKSTSEAEVDAQQLSHQNFSSHVVHSCLLSYDKTVSTQVLNEYVHVMQTYCT